MMTHPQARAKTARWAAQAACLGMVLLLGPAVWARGGMQHGGGGHSAPAPHSQPRPQPRQAPAARPQGGMARRPAQNRVNPGQANRPQAVPGGRPAYNSVPYTLRATPQPGHLPGWMAQHQNMPVGQQERLLRAEPGFNRLNPSDQQREINQLHHLNELPEAQRQRRMARAEAIERLTPAQRMQVNQSARDLRAMAPERQAMLRGAFRDLRGVPVDQRDTMLNSARYSSAFTPQERGILSNLLRVEPYEPPQ